MKFKYLDLLNTCHWAFASNDKHSICLYQTPYLVFAVDETTDRQGCFYTHSFFEILNELKKAGYAVSVNTKYKTKE